MKLSEFRALIAEYALEHPERPLSDVSMVEFATWREGRGAVLYEPREMAEAQQAAAHRRAGKVASFAVLQAAHIFRMTEEGGKILEDFSRKLNPKCEDYQSCDPYSAEPLAHYPDCPASRIPGAVSE